MIFVNICDDSPCGHHEFSAKLKLVQFDYLNLSRRSDGRGGVDGGRQR